MVVNTRGRCEEFQERVKALNLEPHVFGCCERRDLGRGGGKLGLVQIGLKEDIYLMFLRMGRIWTC